MRWTRRSNRKALKALALSFAASASFAGNATAAQVHDGGSNVPSFEPIMSVAQQYGGTAELPAAQQSEIAYLSWGATAENTRAFQSTREGGPVFMNGLPDGYVGSQTTQGGITPTNLARAYVPQVQGVSNPDGYQPQLRGTEQLLIRGTPDGFQPQTKHADVVSISADSSRLEAGDLALGFGLGLILATAGAIALAMSRGRERAAHS
jgi:hypothetical protein